MKKVIFYVDNADYYVSVVDENGKTIYTTGNPEAVLGCVRIDEVPIEKAPRWLKEELKKKKLL